VNLGGGAHGAIVWKNAAEDCAWAAGIVVNLGRFRQVLTGSRVGPPNGRSIGFAERSIRGALNACADGLWAVERRR